eukprot:GHVL01003915.1.p1 GENE.GHVL01003915.1~~GHVL01003915.1.p1  ORF type:complete len:394 (-),score=12.60 GHVL01003915.1:183-1364(-)
MSAGVILSYFTVHSYWMFLLTYGVISGIGSGLCYPVPLACALKWLPNRPGLVSGMVFVGRGLSVFFLTPMLSWYVNRIQSRPDIIEFGHSYYSQKHVLDRVPWMFVYFGCGFAVLQLFGASLLFNPPTQDVTLPVALLENRDGTGKPLTNQISRQRIEGSFTLAALLSCREFWLLWFVMFFNWQAVSFSQSFWKVIGWQYSSLNETNLTIIGAIAALLNTIGRVLWGYIGDALGIKFAMVGMTAIMTIFIGTLPFLPNILQLLLSNNVGYSSETIILSLFSIWICLIFLAHGGAFAIFPAVTSQTFGAVNFGTVFGLLFTARAASSIACSIVSHFVIDQWGIVGMCATVSASTFLSLFLALACGNGFGSPLNYDTSRYLHKLNGSRWFTVKRR